MSAEQFTIRLCRGCGAQIDHDYNTCSECGSADFDQIPVVTAAAHEALREIVEEWVNEEKAGRAERDAARSEAEALRAAIKEHWLHPGSTPDERAQADIRLFAALDEAPPGGSDG